jgi:PilZ domain
MEKAPPTSLCARKHPRALLRMPVRIRWHGPLGTRLETTHTINVSREGLLVKRAESCEAETRAWVVFPYDPRDGASVQPETPATVLRVERHSKGGFRVALRLDVPARPPAWPEAKERRKEARVPFALPIFVRPVGNPWPEESMTLDISQSGARFETSHTYAAGDEVLAKIPWSNWAKAGEIPGRVVRVEYAADSPAAGALADPDADAGAVRAYVAVKWRLQ